MIVWHYTVERCAESILRDGEIRGSGGAIEEKPVVWFSASHTYEPTAAKCTRAYRRRKYPVQDVRGTRRHYGPLYRFGVPASATLPWRKLWKAAGIAPPIARALAKAGRRVLAYPEDWYGIVGTVALSDYVVEVAVETSPALWEVLPIAAGKLAIRSAV